MMAMSLPPISAPFVLFVFFAVIVVLLLPTSTELSLLFSMSLALIVRFASEETITACWVLLIVAALMLMSPPATMVDTSWPPLADGIVPLLLSVSVLISTLPSWAWITPAAVLATMPMALRTVFIPAVMTAWSVLSSESTSWRVRFPNAMRRWSLPWLISERRLLIIKSVPACTMPSFLNKLPFERETFPSLIT